MFKDNGPEECDADIRLRRYENLLRISSEDVWVIHQLLTNRVPQLRRLVAQCSPSEAGSQRMSCRLDRGDPL
jgi:hypothetical protein